MDAQPMPEPPNEEGFADLTGRLDEGPVTMQAIAHLRTEALSKGELHPLDH